MTDPHAWYLIAFDEDAGSRPVAAVHFRFDIDNDDEVLYWYRCLFVIKKYYDLPNLRRICIFVGVQGARRKLIGTFPRSEPRNLAKWRTEFGKICCRKLLSRLVMTMLYFVLAMEKNAMNKVFCRMPNFEPSHGIYPFWNFYIFAQCCRLWYWPVIRGQIQQIWSDSGGRRPSKINYYM